MAECVAGVNGIEQRTWIVADRRAIRQCALPTTASASASTDAGAAAAAVATDSGASKIKTVAVCHTPLPAAPPLAGR